ncbi:MAG: hypothetical protein K2H20_00575, partial [Bacilli bacterium]|nr:hypothetical protein [Bacilli bacterium]
YISFTTNGEKNYIVTTATLITEQSPLDKLFSKYKNYLFGAIIIILGIIILINVINKIRKQKINNEPLY